MPSSFSPSSLEPSQRVRWLKELLRIGLFLLAALAVRSTLAATYHVPSGSMEPSVQIGDRLLAYQNSYGWRLPFLETPITRRTLPKRGDIIVFVSPQDPQILLLKRAIAVAGDTLAIHNGQLTLNGQPIPQTRLPKAHMKLEQLGKHRYHIKFDPSQPFLRDMAPLRIPPGHFFAMGDNRDHSGDSRVFGPVSVRNLRARAVRVLWSIPKQRLMPRWSRSGHALP